MKRLQYTDVDVAVSGESVFSSQNAQRERDIGAEFGARARRNAKSFQRARSNADTAIYNYKNSPFCKFMLGITLFTFCFAAFCLAFVISSNYVCGLGSAVHKISIKNETGLLVHKGIVEEGTYGPDTVYRYYQGGSQRAYLQSFSNGKIPFAVVLNSTKIDSSLSRVRFRQSENQNQTVLAVSQKDRRNVETQPLFFNSGWFSSENVAWKYAEADNLIGILRDGSYWLVPSMLKASSVYPVYFADMSAFSKKVSQKCNSDYQIDILASAFHHFELFLIRQFTGTADFSDITFTGSLILDGPATLVVRNSSVRSVIPVADMEVQFDSGFLNITLPSEKAVVHHGIVGSQDGGMYTMQINSKTEVLTVTLTFSAQLSFQSYSADEFAYKDPVTGDVVSIWMQNLWDCAVQADATKVRCDRKGG